ncbi:hypothetical protein CDAR_56591, partial [Caerostris darwini]
MGYPTASSSFSAVAVCYLRFTEPQPKLHGNGEVFSLQPKWKLWKTTVLFFLVNTSETDGITPPRYKQNSTLKTNSIKLYSFKPSVSHYGVSNRKPFLLGCGGCITCDSLNPGSNYTVMAKCFLCNHSGTLAYGLHKSKIFLHQQESYVQCVRNNTLGRNLFSSKIMEDHCSLLPGEPFSNRRDTFHPGEPFRNRRDKFHPDINKTTHTTSLLFETLRQPLWSIQPQAFPSLLWRCITCDSLNPGPDYTVMEKCFLSNQSGSKTNGIRSMRLKAAGGVFIDGIMGKGIRSMRLKVVGVFLIDGVMGKKCVYKEDSV